MRDAVCGFGAERKIRVTRIPNLCRIARPAKGRTNRNSNRTDRKTDCQRSGLTGNLPRQRESLTIDAQSGPGNLLGNLLCAVANLLNGGSPLSTLLTQLQTLLNQILAAL